MLSICCQIPKMSKQMKMVLKFYSYLEIKSNKRLVTITDILVSTLGLWGSYWDVLRCIDYISTQLKWLPARTSFLSRSFFHIYRDVETSNFVSKNKYLTYLFFMPWVHCLFFCLHLLQKSPCYHFHFMR